MFTIRINESRPTEEAVQEWHRISDHGDGEYGYTKHPTSVVTREIEHVRMETDGLDVPEAIRAVLDNSKRKGDVGPEVNIGALVRSAEKSAGVTLRLRKMCDQMSEGVVSYNGQSVKDSTIEVMNSAIDAIDEMEKLIRGPEVKA